MTCKAGIDYSMTCPAICVGHVMDFSKCEVHFLTSVKKFVGKFGQNIYGTSMIDWQTNEERFDHIASWASSILGMHDVDEVCLEGYSMNSGKGLVFNIGENGGVLKNKLWHQDIKIHTPAPTEIKKFFYGKGNAKKEQMYEAFLKDANVDLAKLLNCKEDKSPLADIVDSYAMLKFGFTNSFS